MTLQVLPFKRKASAVSAAVVLWASRQQVYVPIRPNPSQSVPINPHLGRIEKSQQNQRAARKSVPTSQEIALRPRARAHTHARARAGARNHTHISGTDWDIGTDQGGVQ